MEKENRPEADAAANMGLQQYLETDRLFLEPLSQADAGFIGELVNTEGWLKFIGDRKVYSTSDASLYIQKILNSPNVNYWVVRSKEENCKTGVVTLIKRSHLEYSDIGFAFLPHFSGRGYAKEASAAVLDSLFKSGRFREILAITLPENTRSVQLLQKLGFSPLSDISVEGERLSIYRICASGEQAR